MTKYVKHPEAGAGAQERVGVSSLVFLLSSFPENILMRVTLTLSRGRVRHMWFRNVLSVSSVNLH